MIDQEERASVLTQAVLGLVSTAEAAKRLGLSVRHVRRLKGAFTRHGTRALVHGNRGRQPAHRLPEAVRGRIVLLASTTYADCSHRRLRQVLAEREQIVVSRSTLRRVLLEAGLRSPYRPPTRRLLPGLMPVGFDLTQRRVALLDLTGADFHESSFGQTVERWRRERPEALSLEIDLETFLALAQREPGRLPDGFVFHAGWCGSIVLGNLLSASDEHLVIKESRAVNALLSWLLNQVEPEGRARAKSLIAAALPSMFRQTRGTEQRLFFKLSSWQLRLAATLLRIFPTTPAVFLYRAPDATVASMLAQPPGWQRLLSRPRAIQQRFFPALAAVPPGKPLSPAAFYAYAWRSAAEAALSLPVERLLCLQYDELVGDLAATFRRLLDHFDVQLGPDAVTAACGAQAGSLQTSASLELDAALQSEVLAVVDDLPERLAQCCRRDPPTDDRRTPG
jgi:transposase